MEHPTWKSLQASLPEGLSAETLELIRGVTAPQRHSWRVSQTAIAAIKYVQGHKSDGTPSPISRNDLKAAAQIIELDLHGIGGPKNLGGPFSQTIRMAPFKGLGTGRRQAEDGEIWTSAAEEAQEALIRLATQEEWVDIHPSLLLAICAEFDLVQDSPIVHDCTIDASALYCLVVGEILKEDMPFALSFARAQIADLALKLDLQPIREWDEVLQFIEKEVKS